MTTVGEHLLSTDEAICQNVDSLPDQRSLLSQNILAQLRNLVEGAAVRLHVGSSDVEYNYAAIEPGLTFVRGIAKYNFLGRFHKLLQNSASHYTLDGDASERLMLKYLEYLHRIRALLQVECRIAVLANIEKFPMDLDPSLKEYHERIAERVDAVNSTASGSEVRDRYYIHKTRPFFVSSRIYYEATIYRAVNRVSKFDRLIAFTDIDLLDEYSANLTLTLDSINVIDREMPITIIREGEVSIRPCEFNNFARLLGINIKAGAGSAEYRHVMQWLTARSANLLDLIDLPDDEYGLVKANATSGRSKPLIFPVLDEARRLVGSGAAGGNIIRYLMLRMRNQTLKPQYSRDGCSRLSNLKLQWGCIPFDTMPFCSSPRDHNPRYWDLIASLDATGRDHELLARRVRNNVERHGMLFTPVADLEGHGDVSELIAKFNQLLYSGHKDRQLLQDKGHIFIRGYEDDTVAIIERLQEHALSGISGHSEAVSRWLDEAPRGIDDPVKVDALKRLFSQSQVALIYGAAGTGKSTMVDHIAQYFNDKSKLFLAHTNPAVDNLKRRVTAQNSTFRTVHSQIYRGASDAEYDLLVVDECSTVSNADLLKVLDSTRFKLLVLVGDVFQIESIQFGNWFGLIPSFVPRSAVFELTTPFRTKNSSLLSFWSKVRNVEEDIAEVIARNGYSTVLDGSLFEAQASDEIILCLNYDGLYGINNVNRFLQGSNVSPTISWRAATYKVGDPVLFNEAQRFWPVLYNNLKGRIVAIDKGVDRITFDVELSRPLSAFDVSRTNDLEYVEGTTVRFSVYGYDASDEDDDSLQTIVPFQVAYAVSIHKAQGLEYDSVKLVITDANEDDITHSIFYTAVTRARQGLRIFWTPEAQQAVLKSLQRTISPRDASLLCARRGLTPVT
jgi:hypothetical protein